jgi:alpha-mannosidase
LGLRGFPPLFPSPRIPFPAKRAHGELGSSNGPCAASASDCFEVQPSHEVIDPAVTKLDELIVLIPSHSLEDFPSDLQDRQAASLLNGFQILWDPRLLAAAEAFPTWRRADEVPDVHAGRLVVVPTACEHLLPAGWIARAEGCGMAVVHGMSGREEMLAMAFEAVQRAAPEGMNPPAAETLDQAGAESGQSDVNSGAVQQNETDARDSESKHDVDGSPHSAPTTEGVVLSQSPVAEKLAGDFHALAFCYLQIQLLARHMRHFSNLDEAHFQNETLAAARCAVEGDEAKAVRHLRNAFEVLTETRERFYPVDAYLVDLALVDTPARLSRGSGSSDWLEASLSAPVPPAVESDAGEAGASVPSHAQNCAPLNLLVPAGVLDAVAREDVERLEALRRALDAGAVEVCGGELAEVDTTLLPLESLVWQLEQGAACYRRHLERFPRVYARRRFGLLAQLPQLLSRFGYCGALHLALDDGRFPKAEQAKIRWEGRDGSVIDALAQIPLPADSPATYLRLPERMANTMDHDHVATLVLAHWPDVEAPWYHDLRRMARFSPVLGRFISLERYFQITETPGRLTKFKADRYRSAYVEQLVQCGKPEPLHRYVVHRRNRDRLQEAWWMAATAALISGGDLPRCSDLEARLERLAPGSPAAAQEHADEAGEVATAIETFHHESAEALAEVIMAGAGEKAGYLVVNPLSFARKVPVKFAGMQHAPARQAPVIASQKADDGCWAVVDVPAMGFTWIPAEGTESAIEEAPQPPKRGRRRRAVEGETALAEENVLRNEFLEVFIDPATGGIRGVLDYRIESNRLGQQLVMPLAGRKRPEDAFDPNLPLLEALAQSREPDESYGRMRAESIQMTSTGPAFGEIVARGTLVDPKDGKRLAGYQQRYRLWRGRPVLEIDVTLEPETAPGERPWESYDAARFAWPDDEATLVSSVELGACVTDARRLECPHYLQISSGRRRTALLFAGLPLHQRYGDRMLDTLLMVRGDTSATARLAVALDCADPLHAALDFESPPIVIPTTAGPPPSGNTGWLYGLDARNVSISSVRPLSQGSQPGMRFRLVETEGRAVRTRLRLWRDAAGARIVDFQGKTLTELAVQDDSVLVDLTAFEIANVEVRLA